MAITEVTIRELRNRGGEVVDRVQRGGRVVVTRSGRPVAELRPIPKAPITVDALLGRWRRLPPVDVTRLRRDIDDVMDSAL